MVKVPGLAAIPAWVGSALVMTTGFGVLGWTQDIVCRPGAGQRVSNGDRPIAGVCIAQCSGGGHIHIIAAHNVSLGQFGLDCNRRLSIIGPRIRTGVTVQLHGAVIHGNRL